MAASELRERDLLSPTWWCKDQRRAEGLIAQSCLKLNASHRQPAPTLLGQVSDSKHVALVKKVLHPLNGPKCAFELICCARRLISTLEWPPEQCWAVWCARSRVAQMCRMSRVWCILSLSHKGWWKHVDSRQYWLHSMKNLVAESWHFFRWVKWYSKWWIIVIPGNILHTVK